jgi:hypothetical protein
MSHEIGGIDDYRRGLVGLPDVPLWQQPWWLDATAPNLWDAVCLLKSGRVVAALPYVLKKRYGISVWSQPPLAQALGPWLETTTMKPVKQLSLQHALLGELADSIPNDVYYRQNWTPGRNNWLPFHWRGFAQTTAYTYRLDLSGGADAIWNGMSESTRNTIRKAESRFGVTVEKTKDLNKFLALNEAVFARQGMATPYPARLVRRIHLASSERNASTIWISYEQDGTPSAAAYILRDDTTSFYLMGGSDPDRRKSGSQNLVMWRAIRDATGHSNTFDFEGSIIEPIERSFRSYGSTQVPYFAVEGSTSKWLRRGKAVLDGATAFRG